MDTQYFDIEINENDSEYLQLAENMNIEIEDRGDGEYNKKRELLTLTKITRQTWSILDLYRKIKDREVLLGPNYQRNVVWKKDKKVAFIESLYMGIMIPPIYVVEVPGNSLLSNNKYEVVDGKQRLTAIDEFLKGDLTLDENYLEYYGDIFKDRNYNQLENEQNELTAQMLSGVLDIYVITKNSPEFIKYDIFSRLNKGAEPLKVNEIRRAIYKSYLTDRVSTFVEEQIKTNKEEYNKKFSSAEIKRYDDYGRFFRSVAFYLRSNLENLSVDNYNSRPREMINTVLQNLQTKKEKIDENKIDLILNKTLELIEIFEDTKYLDYYVDACIPFVDKWDELISKIEIIKNDENLVNTFLKSPATTSNVNERLRRINHILEES